MSLFSNGLFKKNEDLLSFISWHGFCKVYIMHAKKVLVPKLESVSDNCA